MSLLKKFVRFTSKTMKRFIFTATLIVSTITFITVMAIIGVVFLEQTEKISADSSTAMARQISLKITEAMESGSDLAGIIRTIDEYQRLLPSRYRIGITPANSIGTEKDREIVKAFTSGIKHSHRSIEGLQHLYPIRAEAGCISCHRSSKIGDILGVLSIKEEMAGFSRAVLKKLALLFLLLLPLPLLMSFFVSRFVNSRLGEAMERLDRKVRSVNSVSDLTTLKSELENEEFVFREIENIFNEFSMFITRIREVAVGKEMLEFEIKVFERFIITSEAIRDWKDRVSQLLNEVNTVMQVYGIFCVFQIEDEEYDIEVFWHSPPSERSMKIMDETVRHRAGAEKFMTLGLTEIKVIHNVVNPEFPILDLDQSRIEFLTKSIFLDTPQIGGVVGIGVQSLTVSDPVRSLVINSILTTMLNVVGSIKAIYKYTKDLEYYATRDPLTNLFNQRVFWELLGYETGRSERHGSSFGLLMIDLDNFKNVNDVYGHFVGDKFLSKVASTIHDCLRKGDILARYGGDEFTVIISESDEEQVYMVANRIRETLATMEIQASDGSRIHGSASIGMAMYPKHAQNPKDLFLFADNMTYKAKSMGRNCVIAPTSDDITEVFEKSSEMSRLLLKVMEEKRVIPYFQPIVTTAERVTVCHEVLCRIEMGDRVIAASEFIEIAEKLSIISRLDNILMEKVFSHIRETGYEGMIFMNLSPKSLILKEFVPMVISLAREYGIRHDRVVFEITERETVKNMTLLEQFVIDLKMEGFKFAIDDFGSGFSSFQYIRRLPIDFVKIEGMFVINMLKDSKDMAFVKTLSLLAREFGIKTIAEYIENEELLVSANEIGIDFAQGYHTGRPRPTLIACCESSGLCESGA